MSKKIVGYTALLGVLPKVQPACVAYMCCLMHAGIRFNSLVEQQATMLFWVCLL